MPPKQSPASRISSVIQGLATDHALPISAEKDPVLKAELSRKLMAIYRRGDILLDKEKAISRLPFIKSQQKAQIWQEITTWEFDAQMIMQNFYTTSQAATAAKLHQTKNSITSLKEFIGAMPVQEDGTAPQFTTLATGGNYWARSADPRGAIPYQASPLHYGSPSSSSGAARLPYASGSANPAYGQSGVPWQQEPYNATLNPHPQYQPSSEHLYGTDRAAHEHGAHGYPPPHNAWGQWGNESHQHHAQPFPGAVGIQRRIASIAELEAALPPELPTSPLAPGKRRKNAFVQSTDEELIRGHGRQASIATQASHLSANSFGPKHTAHKGARTKDEDSDQDET